MELHITGNLCVMTHGERMQVGTSQGVSERRMLYGQFEVVFFVIVPLGIVIEWSVCR